MTKGRDKKKGSKKGGKDRTWEHEGGVSISIPLSAAAEKNGTVCMFFLVDGKRLFQYNCLSHIISRSSYLRI